MTLRKKADFRIPFLSRRSPAALMIFLLLGLYVASVHVAPSLGISMMLAMAVLAVLSLFLRNAPAFHVGLLGTMNLACILVPPLASAWPLSAVFAVGAYVVIVSVSPWLRRSSGWKGWNPPRGSGLALSGILGLLSFALIMVWVWLVRPDLSAQAATVPQASPFALILFGLVFAVLNSFAEEAVYRGVFMHALEVTLGSERLALVLQAAVFGLMHVRGFPSGPFGMMIAGVVGLGFGYLRLRTRGILAPWLAHAIVNAFMYLYLVILAGRTAL